MIMAGGKGERLMSLTKHKSKPIVDYLSSNGDRK